MNKDPWKLFRHKDDNLRQWFYSEVDNGYKAIPLLRQSLACYREILNYSHESGLTTLNWIYQAATAYRQLLTLSGGDWAGWLERASIALEHRNRHYHTLERDDGSTCVYYTLEGDPAHYVVYDTLDERKATNAATLAAMEGEDGR